MSKRMNEIIIRNNYWPNKFFHMTREFKLKDRVALRRNRPGAAECLSEMSVLMSCWKKHDYNDADCVEEVKLFHTCCNEAQTVKREARAAEKSGKIVGRMTSKQVTDMLKQYPQPR